MRSAASCPTPSRIPARRQALSVHPRPWIESDPGSRQRVAQRLGFPLRDGRIDLEGHRARLRQRKKPRAGCLERGDHDLSLGKREPPCRRVRDLRGDRSDAYAHAVPERDDGRDGRLDVIDRRVVGVSRETETSHGYTATATRPEPRSLVQTVPPASNVTSVNPSRPGLATPGSRLAPVKLATNGSLGAATSSCAVPSWRIRPSTSTPTRSASVAASSKSWVTSSVGMPRPASSSWSSARTARLRMRVQRGEGLVEKKDVRCSCQRARERDALPLATRRGPRRMPSPDRRFGDARATRGRRRGPGLRIRRCRARRGAGRGRTPGRPGRPGGAPAAARVRAHGRATMSPPKLTCPAVRSQQPCDGAQHAGLARAGRADERDRLRPDLERQLETEGTETVVEVETERRHVGTSFATRRTRALRRTSSAPIARAFSTRTSNS